MRTRLRPSPGMLVVELLQEETMTESGLHLINAKETSSHIGVVKAINPPPSDDPADYFRIGDWVVIGKWAGTEVAVGPRKEKKFLLVNEDSILATLEEEDGE
jgi:co-chaperonin GroES (HSP10)